MALSPVGSRGSASAPTLPQVTSLFTAAGQVFQGSGAGAGGLVLPPGYEIGYDQITANVNIASTSEAAGTVLITCAPHTFDGSPVVAELFFAAIGSPTVSGAAVLFSLFEGSTELGIIAIQQNQATTGSANLPILGKYRFTPSAGAHTYKVTAFATSLTGTPNVQCGAGGTGLVLPGFIRFTKV